MPKATKPPTLKPRTLPYHCRTDRSHLSDISDKVNSSLHPGEETHRTHPRGFDNRHAEKLKTFVDDLAGSLTCSFPAKECPYPAVYVILVRWIEDDLGVQSELAKLRRTFECQFHFQVEEWYIPSSDPYEFLEDKMFHFKKAHQNESELLIVYYGGHAGKDLRRGRSIWYANAGERSPSLNWYNLQPMLLEANPHVLIILDCCFAANAARDTSFGTAKELLAACGGECETPGVCDLSFTSVLVEELQHLGRTPFTVAILYSRLVTMRHKLKGTPIYVPLSEHGSNSITIAPIPKRPPPVHNQEAGDQDGFAPSDKAGASPGENRPLYQRPPASASFSCFTQLPLAKPETRVLLSVSVSEDIEHNTAQWVHWLTTGAPWEVTKIDVRVESIFKSHSTLILVSIPIFAWTQLAETAAYQFIGFVQSANLYHQSGYEPKTRCPSWTKTKRTNSDLNDSDSSTCSPAKRRRNALPLTPPGSRDASYS